MYFYEVVIIGSILDRLTYQSIHVIELNSIVDVKLRNSPKKALILKEVDRPIFKCNNIESTTKISISEDSLNLAKFISSYYISPLGMALKLFHLVDNSIKKTETKIDIKREKSLSDTQNSVIKFIDKNSTSLIFGDTGSGKTEIYIEYIIKTINSGKEAIFLMPEISLTPQMERRLKDVFGDIVEIWHSKISSKKKSEILESIANGTTKIIAGARSSIFLPFQNLGLIVVDEEHDDSYKSNISPRYNAKDLAIYMAYTFNIKTVLGSATPSINSYYKVPFIRLKGGYFGSSKKFIFDSSGDGITENIKNILNFHLNKNRQAIVFLPTRANFKYQKCDTCNETIKCPFCSIGLSLHSDKNALICHYCNYSQAIVSTCPNCQNGTLKNYRVGTNEVLSILKDEFSNKSIDKFDRDSIKSERDLKRVLKNFNDNKIDILIGTQMLSKGHDYHNVSLAIILGIDSILSIKDYRSREKAISLIIQIAGRSGRRDSGDTVIQSKNQTLISNYLLDYEVFLREELTYRVGLYPPYLKIAKILFSDKSQDKSYKNMIKTLNKIRSKVDEDVKIVGYGEDGVFKVASKYRYHILIRSKKVSKLLKLLHSIKDNSFQVDMDPI